MAILLLAEHDSATLSDQTAKALTAARQDNDDAQQNFLADKVGEWLSVIIGLVFLFCILAMRTGFVGEFTDRLSSFRNKQRAAS